MKYVENLNNQRNFKYENWDVGIYLNYQQYYVCRFYVPPDCFGINYIHYAELIYFLTGISISILLYVKKYKQF